MLVYLPRDAAGIAVSHDILRNIFRNDAARADNAVVPYRHAGHYRSPPRLSSSFRRLRRTSLSSASAVSSAQSGAWNWTRRADRAFWAVRRISTPRSDNRARQCAFFHSHGPSPFLFFSALIILYAPAFSAFFEQMRTCSATFGLFCWLCVLQILYFIIDLYRRFLF